MNLRVVTSFKYDFFLNATTGQLIFGLIRDISDKVRNFDTSNFSCSSKVCEKMVTLYNTRYHRVTSINLNF